MTPSFALADTLRRGETIVTAWVGIPEPLVAEALARTPYAAVTLDMQHGLHDPVSVMRGIGAVASAGKPSIVRVPVGDFAMASRALDFGATAVIAPMINTPADARAFADAMKFPPIGKRSWGPTRAMQLMGLGDSNAYRAWANGNTLAFAMIETTEALGNLDAILSEPGIDGVFVGPSDLSLTLSGGVSVDPTSSIIDAPVETIAARAAAHGKVAAIFAVSTERCRFYAGTGYRFIALVTDSVVIGAGARAVIGRPADAIVGSWDMVSYEAAAGDGSRFYPMGPDASGSLLYVADGGLSAIVSAAGRTAFASGDPSIGSDAEFAAAARGFYAYAGRWSFDPATSVVTHHIAQSLVPNLVGRDQRRAVSFEAGDLVLTGDPMTIGGAIRTPRIRWRRANA